MTRRTILLPFVAFCLIAHERYCWSEPSLPALWTFSPTSAVSASPEASFVADRSGNLYGVGLGGIVGPAVVFRLQKPVSVNANWTQQIIYKFPAAWSPNAGLTIDDDGILYGTASHGPDDSGGSIFRLSPPVDGSESWTESTLYTFRGGEDGQEPSTRLARDAEGALYGSTFHGGLKSKPDAGPSSHKCMFGCGTVFKLTKSSDDVWHKALLYSFTGSGDGSHPTEKLVLDQNGIIYGTTSQGGSLDASCVSAPIGGCGTVFKLERSGENWRESVIYAFKNKDDGEGPAGPVLLDQHGDLYGTAATRLTANTNSLSFGIVEPTKGSGYGLIYKLSRESTGFTFSVVHSFGTDDAGKYPYADLFLLADASILGVAAQGGSHGAGTIFRLVQPVASDGPWNINALASFDDFAIGHPVAPLSRVSGGSFYGVAVNEMKKVGTVYSFTP